MAGQAEERQDQADYDDDDADRPENGDAGDEADNEEKNAENNNEEVLSAVRYGREGFGWLVRGDGRVGGDIGGMLAYRCWHGWVG